MTSPTETAGPEVLIERHDTIACIVLNRAAESNPISWSLGGNLLAALDELEDDRNTSGIVLTGAGSVFCAGAKLGDRCHSTRDHIIQPPAASRDGAD